MLREKACVRPCATALSLGANSEARCGSTVSMSCVKFASFSTKSKNRRREQGEEMVMRVMPAPKNHEASRSFPSVAQVF